MILFTLILFSLVYLNSADQIPCGPNSYKDLDETTSKLFSFGDERRFPTSASELQTYCRESRGYENAVKDYAKKCVTGVAKTLISLTIYNAGRVNKLYCSNRKRKEEFIAGGNCANRNKKGIQKCWKQLSNAVLDAKDYPDDKKKLPITCCNYFKAKDCTLELMRKTGPPTCSDETINHWNTFIDRQAVESLRVVCGEEYGKAGSRACNELLPKVKKGNHSNNKWKSPIIPVIEVLSNIE